MQSSSERASSESSRKLPPGAEARSASMRVWRAGVSSFSIWGKRSRTSVIGLTHCERELGGASPPRCRESQSSKRDFDELASGSVFRFAGEGVLQHEVHLSRHCCAEGKFPLCTQVRRQRATGAKGHCGLRVVV